MSNLSFFDVSTLVFAVLSFLFTVLSFKLSHLQVFGRKVLIAEIIIDEMRLQHLSRDIWQKVPKIKNFAMRDLKRFETSTDRLIVFRIVNGGLFDIKKEDFDGDIDISFGKNSQIVEWGLAKTTNRNAVVKATSKRITISPMFFNRGERLTICTEVDFYEKMKVYAHISGGQEQVKIIVNTNPIKRLVLAGNILMISIGLIIPLAFAFTIPVIIRIPLALAVVILSVARFLKFIQTNITEKYDLESPESELPNFD